MRISFKILLITTCLSILFTTISIGQISTQRVKGRIIDQESNEPIEGVEVELMNYVPLKIVSTDESGEYEFRSIPLGVHRLLLIHEQYQTLIVPDVEVAMEQPTILNIKMKKEVFAASLGPSKAEIIAKKKRFTEIPLAVNPEMLGSNIYDPEQQLRYAGSRLDALQTLNNLPGLRPSASFNNEISIRGQSPIFTAFRIEGVPVPNLNQLPIPQSTAGAFSVLNPYMVDKFDVYTAGINADYGHAAAGVVDAKLKTASTQRHEIHLLLSPIWMEGSMQLPLQRERGQSLSLSYRHSSMQWLNNIQKINYLNSKAPVFQDAFFKLHLPRTRVGDLSIFGLWAKSKAAMPLGSLWLRSMEQDNMLAVGGLRHQLRLAPKIFISSVLGANFHQNNSFIGKDDSRNVVYFQNQDIQLYLNSKIEFRINRENSIFTGIEGDYYLLNQKQGADSLAFVDFKGNSFYSHAFVYWQSKIKQVLSLNIGLQAQYLQLSQKTGLSPRLSLRYDNGNHAVVGQLGILQQELPWFVYLQQDASGNRPNEKLDFMRNYQLNLAYHWRMAENWRLRIQGFGQYIDNIAMAADSNVVFILNNMDYYSLNPKIPALLSNGRGYEFGGDLVLEKFFGRGYYGSLTASAMDGRYLNEKEKAYKLRYNGNYSGALLAGREFNFGAWGRNRFNIDTRFAYIGGRYYTPIDEAASAAVGYEVRDLSQAWAKRSPDYWSWDLRLSIKFSTNHSSHHFVAECLNILDVRSPLAFGFSNNALRSIGNQGRTFVLSYRIGINYKSLKKN